MIPFEKTLSGKLPSTLTKNIAPLINGQLFPGQRGNAASEFWPRTDPVLQFLVGSDEREYKRVMRTSHSTMSAIRQRKMGLTSQGWHVVEGKSHSTGATLLRDWTESFVNSIPKFDTLREEVLDARYLGWMPVELQWGNGSIQFRGKLYNGVISAVARDPWEYRFTLPTATDPAYLATAFSVDGKDVIYNQPEDDSRFMIATSGSTKTPMGESWLMPYWLLYFVSKQFEKMSGTAMQRALGLIKATRKAGTSDAIAAKAPDSKIESEIAGIMTKLQANNVLVESQSFSLELIPAPELAKSIVDIRGYFDELQRISIVGQNLTSSVKAGSLAATNAHVEIGETFQQSDAREEAAWWNSLIRKAILINHPAVDEDDMPAWRSRIIERPSLEATKTIYDMGGAVDGRAIADAYSAALFVGDEGPEDIVLKKQAPPAMIAAPAAPKPGDPNSEPDPAIEQDPATQRTRTAIAPASERAIDSALDSTLDTMNPELERYYAALDDAYFAAYPDPKV